MNLEESHIHMVGIGGSGMSSIAKVLLEMGAKVTGSDLRDSDTVNRLRGLGAQIFRGHSAENVGNADLVVISTAVTSDNPEVVAARERGIPIWHRSEMLARIVNDRQGIAVSGAHGKTTVTSMIAVILETAGKDPTVIIGGELKDTGWGARFGRGPYAVAEADESDRSFLRYYPTYAIVTTIEPDHLEYYDGTFDKLVQTFQEFLGNLQPGGIAILGVDDPVVRRIRGEIKGKCLTYGLEQPADFTARDIELKEAGSNFTVYRHGESLGQLHLAIPGRHNVQNALAATAVALEVGVDFADIRKGLSDFHGAKRRFQFVGEINGILVVDDYAHHPTEIATTIKAAQDGWKRRVVAVFQPHRYTRTHFLMDEFASAFPLADEVIIAGIYSPPPDKPIPGVSAQRLAEMVGERTKAPVRCIEQNAKIIEYLASSLRPGDMVLTMGAGDIWQVARDLVERLREQKKMEKVAP